MAVFVEDWGANYGSAYLVRAPAELTSGIPGVS